jgi:decaprenyl-phosphate phosphoribosyltransferase
VSDSPSTVTGRGSFAGGVIRELRPKQWIKNVLVFAAPAAAGVIDERAELLHALGAFVCFCAAASATYLINDISDVESDRRHPTKRERPIAAGIVPVPFAIVLSIVLLIVGVGGAFLIRRDFGLTIIAYLALTTAYTLWLKHIAVLDIISVAAGFVLRAIGGATATSVPISEWFFIVTSFGALFMVAGKRQGEQSDLGDQAAEVRPVLALYTPGFLTYLRGVFSGGALITYCLWAFSSADLHGSNNVLFQLSIVPFAVAILRYALLLDQGRGAEPENLILSDRALLIAGATWILVYGFAIYTS